MPGRTHLLGVLVLLLVLAPCTLFGQQEKPQPPPLLASDSGTEIDPAARADRFFSRGKLTEAVDSYREALENAAADTLSLQRNRFLLACLLFELGSFAEAKKEFEAVRRADEKARSSEMFARLCDRRAAQPEEPIGDAIEALIVPFLKEGQSDTIAWKDSVMEGLMGEALLRSGPMYLSSRDFGPLLEGKADDPQILLGCSQFLPRTQRTALLQIARKQFPDSSPLQMAAFFSIRYTQSAAAKTQALEALGAAILADPDNAFPRHLRFGLEHYETRRDPATGTLLPYPPALLAELERYNAFEVFDTCADETNAAARRVLRELGHPFQISLIQSNVESSLVLNNMMQRLSATVKAALDGGDPEEAIRINEIAAITIRRWTDKTNSSSLRTMAAASASIMLAHFARYHEAQGDAELASELVKRQREYQARARNDAALSVWPSIAIIPIPSISNHAVERLLSPPQE